MNDNTEYIHGIEVMQGVLKAMTAEDGWKDKASLLLRASDYIDRMRTRHIFSVSFCEDGDLLSQWRGYGDGGMTIGFRYNDLTQVAIRERFDLHKCVYSHEEKMGISRTFIEAGYPPYAVSNEEQALAVLGETLLTGCAFFKHAAFAEEREWRLVSISPPHEYDKKRGFRARGRQLIPYYRIPLGPPTGTDINGNARYGFDEMYVGPSAFEADKVRLSEAFGYLCFNERVSCDTIRMSRIPYRT
jgi:hypothetical protein